MYFGKVILLVYSFLVSKVIRLLFVLEKRNMLEIFLPLIANVSYKVVLLQQSSFLKLNFANGRTGFIIQKLFPVTQDILETCVSCSKL